jgi:hypoxia up-regulated 1
MKLLIWVTCLLTAVHCAVLGIDYGQEFTKGVVVAPGVAFEIVLSQDSKRKDVSGLVFKDISAKGSKFKELERVYGNAASGLISRLPDSMAFYLKPLLGQSLEESEKVAQFVQQQPGTTLIPAKNNRNSVSVSLHGENYPVEELVAMSFADLKARADVMLKANQVQSYIKGATITVPAHFTIEQRSALQDAAEIAGLKLISLVNDGVAVAVNYASTRQFGEEKQHFIIYDVGAGSTTATLVSIRQGEVPVHVGGTTNTNITKVSTIIEVEGVGYNEKLAGQQLTSRVRDYLIDEFIKANPTIAESSLTKDAKTMNKLWREAERVKVVLSANTEVRSSVESLYDGIDFKLKVTREVFEALSEDLVPYVTQPIEDALQPLEGTGTPVDISSVESIILAGGSMRVPFVQQQLQEFVKGSATISKNVNADESAVLGATLRGIGISKIFKSKDIEVVDKSLYGISVEVNGDQIELFPKGTPVDTVKTIPIGATKDFALTLLQEDQPFITYETSNVQTSLGELKDCIDDAVIDAEFFLTTSHTVELQKVSVHCISEEKISHQKSKSKSRVESEQDSNVESETAIISEGEAEFEEPEIITRTKISSRNLSFKPKHVGFRPMGTSSKQSASSRLRAFELADRNRIAREHARNDLESAYYNAKGKVEDNDTKLAAINEIGIWFDNESETASLEALREKIEEIQAVLNQADEPEIVEDAGAEAETEPTKTKTAGEEMVTPFSLPSLAKGGEGVKSSLSEEFNSLANQFDQLFKLFNNLGLDLNQKEDKKIGVDVDKVGRFMEGELDHSDSTVDVVKDTADMVAQMLALERDEQGHIKDQARFDELLASVESQKGRIQEQQSRVEENQSKKVEAYMKMAAEAKNSKLVNEMLESEIMQKQSLSDVQEEAQTTNAIQHEDL